MIDHVYLPVNDVARSRAFYRPLLHTLGIEESFTLSESVVFGVGEPGAFWIYPTRGRRSSDEDACGLDPESAERLPHLHVSFRAETRAQVRDFCAVAEGLGASILHRPRVFPEYHAMYFATFVRDPDGHNIEAVCPSPG
jgi:catechol 2,3-dioxygenase-like lactoylglutathione lyase family enzyme